MKYSQMDKKGKINTNNLIPFIRLYQRLINL
jgi:hypothetical protein